MNIVASGTLSRGEAGGSRAMLTFGNLVALRSGGLLAALRAGSTKDSADETIELYRSDDGEAWNFVHRFAFDGEVNGARGSLKVCYLTELAAGHLMAAAMLIDRTTYPGQPLFHPETEGCLPMYIVLAESRDNGESWSPWRWVLLPEEIGPASLTSPILSLPDGTLAMSIENNKQYSDAGRWYQRVVLFHSHDGGQTWGEPVNAGVDPTGRIYNWDLRIGIAPDGRLGSFAWTYDSDTKAYLNIHRRISSDGGLSWSPPEDIGVTDQAGRPACLPDGRVVLPWVDRFGTRTIRARLAASIDAPFDAASEAVIYAHDVSTIAAAGDVNTSALLVEMSLWTFGLPYAEPLPNGDVLVFYYAGDTETLDIRWARLRV